MRTITRQEIDALIDQASREPRRRMILRLHEHHEPVQRMVNALVPGSYIPPHKHENPDKVELFSILIGRVACLRFDETGEVADVHILAEDGPVKIVDIPPRSLSYPGRARAIGAAGDHSGAVCCRVAQANGKLGTRRKCA